MTNEEIKICLARMANGKTSDVMNFDYDGTLKYICNLEKENRRLKEKLEDEKIIYKHAHNTQMDWFNISCDYKSENAELRARLDKAVEIPFCVIDKQQGKEANEYQIALKEDWAKDLMFCDMDGFAIKQDGSLILIDECGNFKYCVPDRFEIISESRLAELKGK